MNEAQTIWTKRKLLEMDVYIENKGLLKMTDEDWQNVVAMGDKIVADSKDNEAVRNAVLNNLEMWEIAWKEEISNFKKKELWPKQKEKLYFCTVSLFFIKINIKISQK